MDILFAYVLLGIHQTDNIFQGILGQNASHLVKLGLCMWLSGKESTCQCRRCRSLIPGLGRSPGGGHGNPLQYSYQEHPMGREAWQANIHRVTKNGTWLRSLAHISLVQFSHSVMSDSLQPRESQHTRPPCLSPTPRVHWDSRPSNQWCHPAISSSVVPFSSCPQSLPASESFPMSQLFAWGGQSTGVSVLASVLPKKSLGWSPLEWTGWISLQSKGLSRVFSNTTVQKHQFFGAQPSSQSNSHIHTWPQEKP